MSCDDVKPNMKVRTTKLYETTAMLIKKKHLEVRKAGITGTVLSYVPGHGGDVFFVQHDGSEYIGAYCFNELEPAN
jgi:hypothetical protein